MLIRCIISMLPLLLCAIICAAADALSVVRVIPMNARLMTVDEIGNVYVVRDDNTLVRFTEYGDSSAFYRSVQNGRIGHIDAANPLRVVVYYPAFSRIVLLDRMLSQQDDLDLRRKNILNAAFVASSADGNLWVYDQFNARLKKIDGQLHEITESNDLRQETGKVPEASFLLERDWRVFLCDTAKGIFTFDRYGSYINTLPIYGVKSLQVFGSQLVYRHGDTLLSWDVNKIQAQQLILPFIERTIVDARVMRDKIYVLYADALVIFKREEK